MRNFVLATAAVMLVAALFISTSVAEEKSETAQIGQTAPAFSLEDQAGNKIQLSDYAGKTVVLEWFNPNCPFVVRHYDAKTMTALADKHQDVVWLAIATGDSAKGGDSKKFAMQHGIPYPILKDTNGQVAKAYGAKTTPHMYIIDKTGKLVYMGGIDNDPDGSKSEKTNYVDQALSELAAGSTVSTPQSKPYGCGVKY